MGSQGSGWLGRLHGKLVNSFDAIKIQSFLLGHRIGLGLVFSIITSKNIFN